MGSFVSLALASDRDRAPSVVQACGIRLTALTVGARGWVHRVLTTDQACVDRLTALGVTPGAAVVVLQTFPAFVFSCDQTEVAVEPDVAHTVLIELT
jgi:Fe2+ transport system protein FeoA